ncbi:PH domain-containing protein [Candidatus Vampirococcus lugosii]|uniref:Membrane protein, containing Pleckstrin homology domain n=1 Tax=Candidatus Vampirococcus lugosii TaxID=2789015 RepID=A0ABS5QLB7_9BACT|nr:PH domain-containing protein [Candidatus Vampirococcus lugosii]MBS8121991.1 Membrane protein, containing Pleckstrin homology domain [Candidatus Vampirococcus lugosii]
MKTNIKCPECQNSFEIQENKLEKDIECPHCYNVFSPKMQDKNEIYQKNKEFKPYKSSYIIFNSFLLWLGILSAIISLFLIFFLGKVFAILFIVSFIIGAIGFWLVNIMYDKERYLIKDNEIIYGYGTLFQDNEVKLNFKKIVQVKTTLGFFQWNIFGTGTVIIKSAGSGTTNVNIYNVKNPLQLHNLIHSVMKENGFNLSKEKLVQEAKPHTLGVILDILGKYLGIIIFILVPLIPAILDIDNQVNLIINLGFILILLLTVIIPTIFLYLDTKRRYYRVFTDAVYFTDGFLTRRYSFIPFENISDVANDQNFLEKIFGIHDVRLSGQGSNNQFIFKNILYGEIMMENIRYLKDKTILSTSSQKNNFEQKEKSGNLVEENGNIDNEIDEQIGYKNYLEEALDYDKSFEARYKMDMLKSIASTIPFIIIPPVFIILLIYKIIIVKSYDFVVKKDSIESQFSFLSNKQDIFSIERITKLNFEESLIDKLFGTCSIRFSSIGSGYDIVFRDIKKTENLYQNIKNKLGLKEDNLLKKFDINFNIIEYIKSEILTVITFVSIFIPLSIFLIFFTYRIEIFFSVLILFILIFLIKIFYLKYYYSSDWYYHNMYKNMIESINGIIIQKKSYSLIRYLKGIKIKKYPFTNTGSIYINVAGEQVINTNNGNYVKSNYIQIDFIKNVFEKLNQIDQLLSVNKLDTTELKNDKPCIYNSLVPLFIVLFILCAVLMLLDLILGILGLIISMIIIFLIRWYIKIQFFSIQKDRVLYSYGIIYKKYHSIRLDRIDFVESYQGLINKIFKNGNVYIYTIGSSKTEMTVNNIDDYQEFYQKLKDYK